ncbi:helix-turn-helix domain-containing protein [Vibrio cyclitrophicus]|uniref:helix-turn-helix domain-containing protein n=1 Tax=Vibrio cyclitrophicus TaxID=47951 RepID=UPI000C85BCA3|nr:helix-turn-helix transcriptional regulator [Vibrio cyclitrophicus]PMH75011.1 transcriptional regulator [Vibrio cyclitrophicus]
MAKNIEMTPPPDLRGTLTLSLLGVVIKEKRTQNRLTQSEAAFLAGLSKQTYRKIEEGRSDMQMKSLMKVISVLGINILIRP